jgi:hypothetical protein
VHTQHVAQWCSMQRLRCTDGNSSSGIRCMFDNVQGSCVHAYSLCLHIHLQHVLQQAATGSLSWSQAVGWPQLAFGVPVPVYDGTHTTPGSNVGWPLLVGNSCQMGSACALAGVLVPLNQACRVCTCILCVPLLPCMQQRATPASTLVPPVGAAATAGTLQPRLIK